MNPKVFILDQQDSRASRLDVILSFLSEAAQRVDERQLAETLGTDPSAVVLLGAMTSQRHEELLQQFPATAFYCWARP